MKPLLMWMMTYTGIIYWPFIPRPQDVDIRDIAHGLSNLCRYGGQCKSFYSVAEHSWLMSYMVPAEFAFEALLHDGAEAYVGDMIVPLKRNLTHYEDVDARNEAAVRTRFELPSEKTVPVRMADEQIVTTEYETLFGMVPRYLTWTFPPKDPRVELRLWTPEVAEQKFLERFDELTRLRYQ